VVRRDGERWEQVAVLRRVRGWGSLGEAGAGGGALRGRQRHERSVPPERAPFEPGCVFIDANSKCPRSERYKVACSYEPPSGERGCGSSPPPMASTRSTSATGRRSGPATPTTSASMTGGSGGTSHMSGCGAPDARSGGASSTTRGAGGERSWFSRTTTRTEGGWTGSSPARRTSTTRPRSSTRWLMTCTSCSRPPTTIGPRWRGPWGRRTRRTAGPWTYSWP